MLVIIKAQTGDRLTPEVTKLSLWGACVVPMIRFQTRLLLVTNTSSVPTAPCTVIVRAGGTEKHGGI